MHKPAIIGASLAAIGTAIDPPSAPTALLDAVEADGKYVTILSVPLNEGSGNMYAGHRSHRSHSSHSSHRSHSSHSSGSGGYRAPAPSYTPAPTYTAPAAPRYTAPPPSAPATLAPSQSTTPVTSTARPTADQLKLMIMRVQAALFAKGYDPGAIDGTLGAKTQAALRQFQSAQGLPVSGQMTTPTLTALGVSLR